MSEGAPIGLVGLGAMGGRMARLLLEDGHALSVYDTRPDAVAALAERGAVPAGSAAEVADVAETVLALIRLGVRGGGAAQQADAHHAALR